MKQFDFRKPLVANRVGNIRFDIPHNGWGVLDGVDLVKVAFPNGKHFTGHTQRLLFLRGESGYVTGVMMHMLDSDLESTYQAAVTLSRDWGAPLARLEDWYAWHKAGRSTGQLGIPPRGQAMQNRGPIQAAIEIADTYRKDKPFRIIVSITWMDLKRSPDGTSWLDTDITIVPSSKSDWGNKTRDN